jgi:uncharacterized protein (TIGR02246 family)
MILSALCFAAGCSTAPEAESEPAARKLLTDYVATWNRHDMAAFAQLFTSDCDYIVINGRHLKGRNEVFAYHDDLHRGLFKDRQLSATWEDFRFLSDEVAIGHVAWAASGPSSDGRGNTTALGTIVLKKDGGDWLIDAVHNTLLSAQGGSVVPVGDR